MHFKSKAKEKKRTAESGGGDGDLNFTLDTDALEKQSFFVAQEQASSSFYRSCPSSPRARVNFFEDAEGRARNKGITFSLPRAYSDRLSPVVDNRRMCVRGVFCENMR
ncbi:hypothetical protein MRX96_013694 [Rhipicephalus microplus]